MKAKAFNEFEIEVMAAGRCSPVWRFWEYWRGMTAKQETRICEVLENKPDVMKLEREGVRVYQFPTGAEWQPCKL